MDANELTRETGMLWREKDPLAYVAVDKVHGISFSLSDSLYTSHYTLEAGAAKETDVFGVTGEQGRKMSTLDNRFTLDYEPGTFNIKALRQFIAQMRKKSKISPEHIEQAVRERMYFHKDFLRMKQILPIFEFYRVAQCWLSCLHSVPEVRPPIYMQQYKLKASQTASIEPKANGNSNFCFSFNTDRKLVFTEFLDRMMEFEHGTFSSHRRASGYSISYDITVGPDLSELIYFAESRLGKLFSTYYFDLVEK